MKITVGRILQKIRKLGPMDIDTLSELLNENKDELKSFCDSLIQSLNYHGALQRTPSGKYYAKR